MIDAMQSVGVACSSDRRRIGRFLSTTNLTAPRLANLPGFRGATI